MIGLLAPIGLAALAALALPVVIHLLRRPEDRVVTFAAWRYLGARALPRDRLRLREWPLLILRLLLIAVIALLLALPVWRGHDAAVAPWVVVASGVDAAAAHAAVDEPTAQWHRLAPRFPALDAAPPVQSIPTASLLRQLDADLPEGVPLIVVVPAELAGLDAERLRLSRAVRWQIVPSAGVVGDPTRPLKLSIRSGAGNEAELRTAQALIAAWKARGSAIDVDIADARSPIPADCEILIWLAGAPPSAVSQWIARGGTALLSQQPAPADAVAPADEPFAASRQGRGRLVNLVGTLDAAKNVALRSDDVPERLRTLLFPEPHAPQRAYAATVAPLTGADVGTAPGRPLDQWLIALSALLFAAERLWTAIRAPRT